MRARGVLACGVNTGLAGFSAPNDKGEWAGIDADFCRAIAAAVLKDPRKVRFVPLNAKERFTALQSGEIDVLSRNTTWTMSRDTSLGLNFTGVMYYDGQAFMVRKSLGLTSVRELAGASICVQTGTTNEQNLADYFATTGLYVQARRLRASRRGGRSLHVGPLRRLHDRLVPSHLRAHASPHHTPTQSCPELSRRSRSARPCARAMRRGPTSCAGSTSPC